MIYEDEVFEDLKQRALEKGLEVNRSIYNRLLEDGYRPENIQLKEILREDME